MRRIPVLIALLVVNLCLHASTTWTQSAHNEISVRFKISGQSLENLRSENVPYHVLNKLEEIKGQKVWGEAQFLTRLKDTIGEERTVQYKSLILKHTDISVCEYQERRKNIPINSKANQSYTTDKRNQGPFAYDSRISKDDIKTCLGAGEPIQYHHILFEDYRDAWHELAEKKQDYTIPLLIEGGVLHAKTPYTDGNMKGGIRLGEFRIPRVKNISDLTDKQREIVDIKEKDTPIALISAEIIWSGVFIDSFVLSAFYTEEIVSIKTIFEANIKFRSTIFSKGSSFTETVFLGQALFRSTFGDVALFTKSVFNNWTVFRWTKFYQEAYFNEAIFRGKTDFNVSSFYRKADFEKTVFYNEIDFLATTFYESAIFKQSIFYGSVSFNTAGDKHTTFNELTDFSESRFKKSADFREAIFTERLILDNSNWENRVDFRGMSAKALHWDSTNAPSEVKGVFDMRDAHIGRTTIKEVRFQDVVDFSRTTLGQYKVDLEHFLEHVREFELTESDILHLRDGFGTLPHPSPHALFTNNTFEKETDFLNTTFHGSTLLINNRFRSTLDLTGAAFTPRTDHLCLSFNRIHRLVLGLDNLGHPLVGIRWSNGEVFSASLEIPLLTTQIPYLCLKAGFARLSSKKVLMLRRTLRRM